MALRYTLYFMNLPKNQEENPIIDSLQNYVQNRASAAGLILNDIPPFDMALNTSVKIQLADTTAFTKGNLVWNYCMVKYQDPTLTLPSIYYFWVKQNTRFANQVILFTMEMDALNTFKSGIEASCRTSKNHIVRCHVDRYAKSGNTMNAIVDDISEGFGLKQYESPTAFTRIEYPYTVNGTTTYPFRDRDIHLLMTSTQGDFKQVVHTSREVTYTDLEGHEQTIRVPAVDANYTTTKMNIGIVMDIPAKVKNNLGQFFDWDLIEYMRNWDKITEDTNKEAFIMNSYIDHTIDPWQAIDKSVNTTIKVKMIPYPPVNMHLYLENGERILQVDDSIINQDAGVGLIYWPIPAGAGALFGTYTAWGRYLNLRKSDNLVPFPKLFLTNHTITLDLPTLSDVDLYTDWQYNDPKIYHSDFFTAKYFYYDKFYQLKPENVYCQENTINSSIWYQVTTEISLDFLFQIDPGQFKHKESDYEGYVIVSSAPENTLFSSEYINYMRNGYGYDQNNHTYKLANSIISLISSSIRHLSGMAESAAEEDYAEVFASSVDLIGGFVRFAGSEISWQNNMERKIVQLQQQSPQISDSKNGQLIKEITGNRICYSEYKPKPSEIDKLNRLFHYYGYYRELYGQFPYNTRSWFNFCQGDIHLENRIPEYAIPDVKRRFSRGVTFYHYNGEYDWEQVKENWEVSLL